MITLSGNMWLLIHLALAIATAMGWAYFDGRKRRKPSYRERIVRSLAKMPTGSRKRFFVLFLPHNLSERLTQATIIGLGSTIILLPIWLISAIWLSQRPFMSLFITVAGGIIGGMLGELLLNRNASIVSEKENAILYGEPNGDIKS